jgi:hypothetical protein
MFASEASSYSVGSVIQIQIIEGVLTLDGLESV